MSYRGGRGRGGRGRGGGGGRGEYYKNKYGGGGRGRGGGGGRDSSNDPNAPRSGGNNGGSYADLIDTLWRIDSKSYPAYHDIESSDRGWMNDDDGFSLYIGRAQSDPFARPTRCRIVVPASTANFPAASYENSVRAVALADYVNRAFYALCKDMGADQGAGGGGSGGGGWSGPKGGDVQIVGPTQHVLEQSAVTVNPRGDVCAQFTVNLPARGRTILGQKAADIFERVVPEFVRKSLVYSALNGPKLQAHVLSVEDQHWLRSQLESSGLVAFVPDGAVLPRASGADDRPMADTASQKVVRFETPESLKVSFHLPNGNRTITGMGVRKGVSLIVGGGFHGKSTLLSALQLGVYNKIPGDGRELCVCDENAVKIRAEDGRAVSCVDISSFISNLPFGKGTDNFSTADASGSTSQASNIVEALEVGTKTLLVDEDTCATNFMIRDDKMMELVAKEKEPITPFIHKIRSLYEDYNVSSVLVIGGSGDYFDVADTVIMLDCYKCLDVTKRAKEIASAAASVGGPVHHEASSCLPFGSISPRYPIGSAYKPKEKVNVRAKSVIAYGDVELDLSGLEQIASLSQTNSLSLALQRIASLGTGSSTLSDVLANLNAIIDKNGLDSLAPGQFHGGLARPRLYEIAGAVNRLRRDGNMVQK